jgi:hypothetical protein
MTLCLTIPRLRVPEVEGSEVEVRDVDDGLETLFLVPQFYSRWEGRNFRL